jgi:transcriptional regulator with XRE-family HTH domain
MINMLGALYKPLGGFVMYRDDRIRSEMLTQRLTDDALAEKTGLTRQTIALYRKGEAKDPKLSTLQSIATALGKDVLWLIEPKPVEQAEPVAA